MMIRKNVFMFAGLVVATQLLTVHAEPAKPETAKPVPTAVKSQDNSAADEALFSFLPDVVARYGDKEVTAAEVKAIVMPQVKMARKAGKQIPVEQIKQGVYGLVNSIIDQNLLLGVAQKDGFVSDKKEAVQRMTQMKAQMGEENYGKFLEQQAVPEEKLVQQMSDALAINHWVEGKLIPANTVAEKELKAYYDANTTLFQTPESISASHILVKFDPKATKEEKAKARKVASGLLKQLKAGEDFAKLAKDNSDCPSSKNGGDLGYFTKGQMVPAFEKVAMELKPGEISDVVETRFGFHIIKGGERKAAGSKTYDEVKGTLTERMQRQKTNEAVRAAIEKVRKEIKVEILFSEK